MADCKIRVIKPIEDLFPEYQPEVGKIYEARYHYCPRIIWGKERDYSFCTIKIRGKEIIIRKNEFEFVEGTKNA